jgi:Leucine-rich repeat (LRR) protein
LTYHLHDLEELDLSYNKLYSLPKEIKRLKKLNKLSLYGNDIPWEVEMSFKVGN